MALISVSSDYHTDIKKEKNALLSTVFPIILTIRCNCLIKRRMHSTFKERRRAMSVFERTIEFMVGQLHRAADY